MQSEAQHDRSLRNARILVRTLDNAEPDAWREWDALELLLDHRDQFSIFQPSHQGGWACWITKPFGITRAYGSTITEAIRAARIQLESSIERTH